MNKTDFNVLMMDHAKQFKNCQLCKSVNFNHKIFWRSVGHPITYLFVGEAPGPSETVTKKPFTGPAGKVLDALLNEANVLKYGGYGITNTIACFPSQPDNPTKFRKPERQELLNCKSRLDDVVEIATAQFYIALGQVALKNPPTGITFHLQLDHPSYILRRGGINSNDFKRNKHRLIEFLMEND